MCILSDEKPNIYWLYMFYANDGKFWGCAAEAKILFAKVATDASHQKTIFGRGSCILPHKLKTRSIETPAGKSLDPYDILK